MKSAASVGPRFMCWERIYKQNVGHPFIIFPAHWSLEIFRDSHLSIVFHSLIPRPEENSNFFS